MNGYVYEFYQHSGQIKCRKLNSSTGERKIFKRYTDALDKIMKMHEKTVRIKPDIDVDLTYMVGENKIILKKFSSLIENEDIRQFRHILRSKALKTSKIKANFEFLKKNKKLIIIAGVAVVLSATIAVSSVMAQPNDNLDLEQNSYSGDYYTNYDIENDDNLSYEINFECGSQLKKCQDFFENSPEECDIIRKYSECYGVDCNLVKAIAYQESKGNHNVSSNPCAYGIMQIENVHLGSTIQSYNFVTGQIDKIKITEDVLKNKEKNVQVGIMIYRNNLNEFNNNPILALQAYNFGAEGLKQVLKIAANDNNIDVTEFINDPTNQMWLDYRNYYPYGGDKKYTENVMQYCTDTIQNLDQNDNIIEFKFNSYIKNKKK